MLFTGSEHRQMLVVSVASLSTESAQHKRLKIYSLDVDTGEATSGAATLCSLGSPAWL
jgi:hypothetical protein